MKSIINNNMNNTINNTMNKTMKLVLTLAALFMATAGWAESTVNITKQINGDGIGTTDPGTVVTSIADGTCTLTVTPAADYYVTAENITAYSTVPGDVAQGILRAPSINEGTITVTATDSSADPSGVTTYTFTMPTDESIVQVTVDFQSRISISDATFGEIAAQTYTGSALTPTPTLTLGNTTLTVDTDFTFSYENNTDVPTQTSEAQPTIIATGKGIYTGTASTYFTINAATISASAENVSKTYDGEAYGITVNVTVPSTGASILYGTKEGEYTAETCPTYSDPGTYTIYYKVSATNYTDFTGSATVTISQAAGTISYATTAVVKTYGDAAFTNELTNTGDGTVTYASSDATVATVSTTGAVTIVGVGTATITATVTDGTNSTYATKTASYTLTVKPNTTTLTVALSNTTATYTYNGSAQTPAVTVKSGTTTLTATTDYTVAYSNNTAAGEATITVTGVGNYEGASGSIKFQIAAKNISEATISDIAAQAYTGEEIKPEITVTDGETTLIKGTDYTVAYADNTAVGSATVTITGTGNYTGTKQTSFIINTQLDVTFADGQTWATYVSTMDNLTVPSGLKAYVVTAISGTTVTVSEIDYLPAEYAVLLEKTSTAGSTFTAQLYEGEILEIENMLQATFEETPVESIDAANVYVLYNNEFRRTTTGSIPANRGYLALEATAGSRLTIVLDESATAIRNISVNMDNNNWYTLDGRKLTGKPSTAGCYIYNGKKIFVSKK